MLLSEWTRRFCRVADTDGFVGDPSDAGYDALYQFAVQDRGDHYWVQGYMVALHEVEEDPNAPTGADFAVPTPAQASLNSPSKQAKVTEGSEAG